MLLPVQQFKDFINAYAMFKPQDKVLLAVSGGKDSVAMTKLFAAAGFHFGIAHCNFNLRGEESVRDQQFVEKLALSLNAPIHVQHFDTEVYARTHKISIQMAARDLRYQFFETTKNQFDYQKIAIAQHQNDAMETVILNLIRGTGIAGLHGIKPHRHDLIRPMLCFNSSNVEEMIEENDFKYVEDSSNASTKYLRNKIRLDIIPQMKKLNPSLEDTFRKQLDYFSELEELLIAKVEEVRSKLFDRDGQLISISIDELLKVEPQKLILFELLKPFGFNLTIVQNILSSLQAEAGKQFFSDTHVVILDRTHLLLSIRKTEMIKEQSIQEDQKEFMFGGQRLTVRSTFDAPKDYSNPAIMYVAAEELIFPLRIRIWQEGDRFKPFGMDGMKKVSDFFINQKIPLNVKRTIPILLNGDGKIIWVCGYRSDDRFKVKPDTKKIITFELKKN